MNGTRGLLYCFFHINTIYCGYNIKSLECTGVPAVKLYNYESPYQDEWFLSHFLRILRLNALDLAFFEIHVMGKKQLQNGLLDLELKKEFRPFYEALDIGANIGDFHLSTSVYPFQAIFLTSEEQKRYRTSVLHDPGDEGTEFASRSTVRRVNICPVCMQEDQRQFGEPYFHRSHQLPGVCICPAHHDKLMVFTGHVKNLDKFDINDYSPISRNIPDASGIAYAEYAQRILFSSVTSDLLTVKQLIQSEFEFRGYKPKNLKSSLYKGLAKWQHASLFGVPAEYFSPWLREAHYSQAQNVLALLMFLFPDPCNLIERLSMKGKLSFAYISQRINDVVGNDYELLEYHEGAQRMTLKHSCGMVFEVDVGTFFDGGRCAQCAIFPSRPELIRVLKSCSNKHYASPSNISARNKLPVLDTDTKEANSYSKERIMQELSRPTPSPLFPDLTTGHHFADWKQHLQCYLDFRAMYNGWSRPPDSDFHGIDLRNWCATMRKHRKEGKLSEERIQILSDAGFQW